MSSAQDVASAYDEVPYPSSPYPYTHPDHLATLATLFGLQPAPPARARVLEVGCGDGANLIPLAVTLPQATLVGIDLSERQIDSGRRVVECLGLGNIELRAGDLCALEAGEPFDYIIAYGVLSWTPREMQEGLLRLCRRRLAPQGVALISYNTFPGWRERHAIRNWILAATPQESDTPQRLARARECIARLRELLQGARNPQYLPYLSELERLAGWNDAYLRHDLLEDNNEPLHFEEFVERLARHELRFFAEADFATMAGAGLPAQLVAGVQRLGRTLAEREQLLDLCTNRAFRQSLVCHQELRPLTQVGPAVVRSLYAASTLRSDESRSGGGTTRFVGAAGFAVDVSEPLVTICLRRLAARWPAWESVATLLDEGRRELSETDGVSLDDAQCECQAARLETILLAAFAERAVELHVTPPPFVVHVSDRPLASPLARLQARQATQVTNLRHDLVPLDTLAQAILPLLDGTRDRPQLLQHLQSRPPTAEPAAASEDLPARLDDRLARLARAALLQA